VIELSEQRAAHSKSRQTSADLTASMIEAGASVLRDSGRVSWNAVDWAIQELAGDVFRAMVAASVHSEGVPPSSGRDKIHELTHEPGSPPILNGRGKRSPLAGAGCQNDGPLGRGARAQVLKQVHERMVKSLWKTA
jgi:hypothetical protein